MRPPVSAFAVMVFGALSFSVVADAGAAPTAAATAPTAPKAKPTAPKVTATPAKAAAGKAKAKPGKKKHFGRMAGIRYVRQPLRVGISWDFQYEQGFMLNDPGPFSRRWFGRVRGGILLVKEPWILALGAVMEGAGVPSLAYGLQVEVTHLWRGVWAQATVSMDGGANMFSALSAGFSLLGFEWQRRLSAGGTVKNGYLLKLRIPVGIALFLR
jgi:hypothetical protein